MPLISGECFVMLNGLYVRAQSDTNISTSLIDDDSSINENEGRTYVFRIILHPSKNVLGDVVLPRSNNITYDQIRQEIEHDFSLKLGLEDIIMSKFDFLVGGEMIVSTDDEKSCLRGNVLWGSGDGTLKTPFIIMVRRKPSFVSLTDVRVKAVNIGEYTFMKIGFIRTAQGKEQIEEVEGEKYTMVRYYKEWDIYDEQVELLDSVHLKRILKHYYHGVNNKTSDQERISPIMIAQSPNVFWSLVFYHSYNQSVFYHSHNQSNIPVNDMLRKTLPKLDWCHLKS